MRDTTIQWTNRDGRGWSVGMEQNDPRTGEVLHAVVQLDSHRVRTVNNFWNVVKPSLVAANNDSATDMFADLDSADPNLSEDEEMLHRIALLTCNKMGHALCWENTFAATPYTPSPATHYSAPL